MPNYVSWPTPLLMKLHRKGKFKQRAVLAEHPELVEVQGHAIGICIGLVIGWIRRRLAQPAEGAGGRLAFLAELSTLQRAQTDSNQFHQGGATGPFDRIGRAAPNMLGLNRQSNVQGVGKDDLASLVEHVDAHLPGYYLWELTFAGGSINHAFAFYADARGMDFFDPNSGEYHITAKNKLRFFQQLCDHYRSYVSASGVASDLRFDDLYLMQLG